MLRRKLSAGVLNATRSAQATGTAAQIVKPQSQQAALASAVLLSSSRNWKNETVPTLKNELKRRGLSQTGNKATLISRLTTAELPPMPTARPFSSSPSTPAPASKKSKAPESTTAPVSSDTVASTGPAISTPQTQGLKPETIAPELVTVAPGLPESRSAGLSVEERERLDVKLPKYAADKEVEQTIPSTPDNFLSNATTAPEPQEDNSSSLPKIMTVASSSTHLSGGPVHASQDSTDAHSHEMNSETSPTSDSPSVELPSVGSLLALPGKALSSSGIANLAHLVPEIGVPELGTKQNEYKADGKPLNAEERRGAWILAGIAATALFLGGPKKEKKAKSGAAGGGKGKEGKVSGAKGDAQWEKASGAGVVGHGSRKD
ncbi:hypothetical protein P7C73_g5956, partial [Tremellales sp. Uapishka_1]